MGSSGTDWCDRPTPRRHRLRVFLDVLVLLALGLVVYETVMQLGKPLVVWLSASLRPARGRPNPRPRGRRR